MLNNNPEKTPAWEILKKMFDDRKNKKLSSYFAEDSQRFNNFSLKIDNILLDYSKNHLDREVFTLLLDLAAETGVKDAIENMFKGGKINVTENRAVLHTALRSFSDESILVEGENVLPKIKAARAKMKDFADKFTKKEIKGYSGKDFTDIVNIGIGGSDLGPKMVCQALEAYSNKSINIHFVSNVDPTHIHLVLNKINPATTLFMIASKTFTTQETMANANQAKTWFLANGGTQETIKKHFVALSTNKEKVEEFGIDSNNMFEFWDFVGGRYSVWSSIGLSVACYLGYNNFENFLKGAEKLDKHFKSAPLDENLPVILALIGIWYNNFWRAESEVILPYDQYLDLFADYFQQGNMESNGKSVDRNGNKINYQTGPVIWGQPGTNGQHAFYQLIHQGTKLIPADFLAPVNSINPLGEQHEMLISNFLAQTESLMIGRDEETVEKDMKLQGLSEKEISQLLPYRIFEGNKPSNTIFYDSLTPETLGFLIAMYEHKIFTQGIIWNIYSFDQWGVELGKKMAGRIFQEIKEKKIFNEHDDSTKNLLKYYLEHKK